MQKNNNTMSKVLIMSLSTLALAGLVTNAQITIPSNINNAVQTIKEVRITSDGTNSGTTIVRLNGSGDASSVMISGNVTAGTIAGFQTNRVV
jgi:hypothetical protein